VLDYDGFGRPFETDMNEFRHAPPDQ
jgi:hypothetical protein